MTKILITGSQGFIGSYLCAEFLDHGYEVIGVDNFSKYGPITRSHDNNQNFHLLDMDVRNLDIENINDLFINVEYIIAGASMIGGISYFHKYAYDLLATNERIIAQTFDLAIKLHQEYALRRILVLSSSMVFESTKIYPTPEIEVKNSPPALSTYGFQKLAAEYFCKGAYEQYGLPFTIIRPFNCVGVGEEESIGESKVKSGNINLMMSHVLPDLINKILKGQNPVHILGSGNQIRCYTNGKDIARGIRMAVENKAAICEDFNISTSISTTVLELAQLIWEIVKPGQDFNYVSEKPYEYDVQKRIPDTTKAERILGFKAKINLKSSVEETINYMKNS
jgi:nucleoside-diphosphate-sugar epimerase|tara:strand:+ start:17112 stop:18122 length:1011 start_codon:yes stop_codon:yes gene_type:complete